MNITLHIDGGQPRVWLQRLAERLTALDGVRVSVVPGPSSMEPLSGLETLFQLERVLSAHPDGGVANLLPQQALAQFMSRTETNPDLRIDLRGSGEGLNGEELTGETWTLTFDGLRGEQSLLAVLLAKDLPRVELIGAGGIVSSGNPGTEYGGNILGAFEDILARTITLIVSAVRALQRNELPKPPNTAAPSQKVANQPNVNLPVRAARMAARAILRKIYYLCYNAPHWRVGWRKTNGADLFDLRQHPETGWIDLPDDGSRFYADPFPILHEGKVTLFVEDYVHRLSKGLVSAVTFGPDGPIGQPVPVLEVGCHLSYPNVFARDGEIWMIPESCATETIDLYRATDFPGGWVKEATLVSGLAASDATLIEHGGRHWMFATVRDGGGAFSDALHLWSAQDFRGPWTPHPRNPVMIDIASARPAGRMVERNGALYRPFQDCRRGYGAAMGIARVTRLDDESFLQEVETLLEPGQRWPGSRLHSLNSAGGLEFIDGSAFAPRWKALFR